MRSYAHHAANFSPVRMRDIPRQKPHFRPAIECRQCGDSIYIPEWSEWLDAGRARHLWQCDACGYAFETTVYFAAA